MEAQLGDALAACRRREDELREQVAAHAALAADHEALKAEHERFVGALREQAARLGALADGGSSAAGASGGTEDPGASDAGREEERA
jgi:hypothetical protein